MRRFKLIMLLSGILLTFSLGARAMSMSRVKTETRFLTDKMAYELNLSMAQYNDVYEINFDFIYNVRNLMDKIAMGYAWAIDEYYTYLDIRNDDLSWVLADWQFRRFLRAEHFFRPIYLRGSSWNFRVYLVYTNHHHYYYPRPRCYRTYRGGNCRHRIDRPSYYRNRYNHARYQGGRNTYRISGGTSRRRASLSSDFGSVRIRPNTSVRPSRHGSSESVRGTSSTSRHGSSESVRGTSSTNRRGSSESVRGTSSTNRRGSSESVRSKNSTYQRSSTSGSVRRTESTSRKNSTVKSPDRPVRKSTDSVRRSTTSSKKERDSHRSSSVNTRHSAASSFRSARA